MEFKDKIMLHNFWEVKCWWEVVEVGSWERRENGDVGGWEVPGFIREWGTQGESKILSFCF